MSLHRSADGRYLGEVFYCRRGGEYVWRIWDLAGAFLADGAANTRSGAESMLRAVMDRFGQLAPPAPPAPPVPIP
jgi:hypothetical protein